MAIPTSDDQSSSACSARQQHCSTAVAYRLHGNAVSEKEVAEAGCVVAGAVGLKGGEGLEDVEGSVFQPVRGEAQTQVHGVCRSKEEGNMFDDSTQDHNMSMSL